MTFDQMYQAVIRQGGPRVTLVGRPGIGKTKNALRLASKYIEETGQAVLYITGRSLDLPVHRPRKELISSAVSDKLIIWEEIYKYCDENHLPQKVYAYCESHTEVGLVIFDDESLLEIRLGFVLSTVNIETALAWPVKVLFLADAHRRSEHRRRHLPKLRDISKPLRDHSSEVLAIYNERYFYFESRPDASDEYEFIKLK